jgi:hypothetical protein
MERNAASRIGRRTILTYGVVAGAAATAGPAIAACSSQVNSNEAQPNPGTPPDAGPPKSCLSPNPSPAVAPSPMGP